MSVSPAKAVMSLLLGDGDVVAEVDDRVHRVIAPPHSSLPHVVVHNLGGGQEGYMGGASPVAETRLQIDSWARTITQAETVATAVRLAMLGAEGGAVGRDDLEVSFVSLDTEFEDGSLPDDGSSNVIPRIIQEYRMGYKISVPS